MKKTQRIDKKIRARKGRALRRLLIHCLGQHDRWSQNPEHLARYRAYVSTTKHSLERVLGDGDVFDAANKWLEEAILARKRTR